MMLFGLLFLILIVACGGAILGIIGAIIPAIRSRRFWLLLVGAGVGLVGAIPAVALGGLAVSIASDMAFANDDLRIGLGVVIVSGFEIITSALVCNLLVYLRDRHKPPGDVQADYKRPE
jgi:hypothetical protein